jgi:hypothetical protein
MPANKKMEYILYLVYYSPNTKSNDYYIIDASTKELFDFLIANKNVYLNEYLYEWKNKKYLQLYKDASFTQITEKQFNKVSNPIIIYNTD